MKNSKFLFIIFLLTFSSQMASALPIPVGWWKLDEGTGTFTSDASGNGHNGTLQNGPTWVSGALSNALNVSGTNAWVRVPFSSSFNFTNSMSVALWIRLTQPWVGSPGTAAIFSQGGYDSGWALEYSYTGQMSFQMTAANGNSISSNMRMPTNLWTHVVATFDGTNASFYIDGLLDSVMAWAGSCLTNTNDVLIGNLPDGSIDDARIYNRALPESEVVQIYALGDRDLDRLADVDEIALGTDPNNPDTDGDGFPDGMEVLAGTDPLNAASHPNTLGNLVAWWKLNEGVGTLTADATTNGNTGTLSSSSLWTSGILSNAVGFNGTSDYAICGPAGTTTPLAIATNTMSISFWAYVTNAVQADGFGTVLDRWTYFPTSGGYMVFWDSTHSQIEVEMPNVHFDNLLASAIPFDTFQPNAWNHFAFSYSGTNLVGYINGVPVGVTAASNNNLVAISQSVYMGKDPYFGWLWTGSLDDVRIFNRGLSAGDVAAMALVCPMFRKDALARTRTIPTRMATESLTVGKSRMA